MQVAVFVKATPSSEAGIMPDEFTKILFEEMGRFNESLVEAGIMKDGAGLHPSADGVRVRFSGSERMVIDGPFTETNELVAGYWLWEVSSMEEAVSWVKRCPNPMPEDSEIEIRPIYSAEELEPVMTSEQQSDEEQLSEHLAMSKSTLQPYLFFGGRCEEALTFYKKALHAKIGPTLRWSECPEPPPADMLQPGYENKIMHAEFTIGNITLMASDGCGTQKEWSAGNDTFRLTLTVADAKLANNAFQALAANGGTIDMPLAETFFSPYYGMVTDCFGIGWMVMVQ